MAFRIETNAEEVARLFKEMQREMPQRVKGEIIADYVTATYTLSQIYVPVRTGRLQKSGSMNKSAGTVTYRAPYAKFVEWGTRFMAAQPYVRPAMKEALQLIKRRWRPVIQKLFSDAKARVGAR